MEERQTIELVLPKSGARVILFAYLRNGDFRQIQRKIADQIKIDPANPSKPDIKASLAYDEQEFGLELLTKEVFNKAGEKIENTKDFYYDLDMSDGEILYAKINEITQGSTLDDESRKK